MTFSNYFFFCHLCSSKSCWKGGERMKGSGRSTVFSGMTIMTGWAYSELSVTPMQVQPQQKPVTEGALSAPGPFSPWFPKNLRKTYQKLGRNPLCLWMSELPTVAPIPGYRSKSPSQETRWPRSALNLSPQEQPWPGTCHWQPQHLLSFIFFLIISLKSHTLNSPAPPAFRRCLSPALRGGWGSPGGCQLRPQASLWSRLGLSGGCSASRTPFCLRRCRELFPWALPQAPRTPHFQPRVPPLPPDMDPHAQQPGKSRDSAITWGRRGPGGVAMATRGAGAGGPMGL